MNTNVHLISTCWHDGALVSEGPTTNQRNWWCPACGQQRVTYPGDTADSHFKARMAQVPQTKEFKA